MHEIIFVQIYIPTCLRWLCAHSDAIIYVLINIFMCLSHVTYSPLTQLAVQEGWELIFKKILTLMSEYTAI